MVRRLLQNKQPMACVARRLFRMISLIKSMSKANRYVAPKVLHVIHSAPGLNSGSPYSQLPRGFLLAVPENRTSSERTEAPHLFSASRFSEHA